MAVVLRRSCLPRQMAATSAWLPVRGHHPPGRASARRRVVDRRREAAAAWTYVFELADRTASAGGLPGQFVTVRMRSPVGGAVLRSFSLSGPVEGGRLQVTVKREDTGVGSRLLVDSTQVGDLVELAAPRGGFLLADGDRSWPSSAPGSASRRSWQCCTRWPRRRERDRCGGCMARAMGGSILSRLEARGLLPALPQGIGTCSTAGRTRATVRDGLRRARGGVDSRCASDRVGVSAEADFYLCRPPSSCGDVRSGLARRGFAAERGTWRFSRAAPADARTGPTPSGSRIRPADSRDRAVVSFARSGWPPGVGAAAAVCSSWPKPATCPFAGRAGTGVCHSCESGLVSGAVTYSPRAAR